MEDGIQFIYPQLSFFRLQQAESQVVDPLVWTTVTTQTDRCISRFSTNGQLYVCNSVDKYIRRPEFPEKLTKSGVFSQSVPPNLNSLKQERTSPSLKPS